ncbi:MAG: formylglycine-generating enzyme family protein [Planctomycetales bacterium]|nr:formylglycine-generating enzyme family protein [Planctomycetales bacterium]
MKPPQAERSVLKVAVIAMAFAALSVFPLARLMKPAIDAWMWPPIPKLAETDVSSGLRFDGKDDFVKVGPIDLSSPQYTLEAFVTSAGDGDNGVIALLKSDGKEAEVMYLYDGYPAKERQSGAGIIGQRPFQSVNAPLRNGINSEGPQHKVILTQPIYLGVHEVTQGQYVQVMGKNPCHFAPMGAGKDVITGMDTTNHPVEMVNWNDAAEFSAKLSPRDKLKPFHSRADETVTRLGGTGNRLPSEAEWEFACRAGTTSKYWTGSNDADLIQTGWFIVNSGGRTHAVGELKSNPFGLYDMHGNVWDGCRIGGN